MHGPFAVVDSEHVSSESGDVGGVEGGLGAVDKHFVAECAAHKEQEQDWQYDFIHGN